MTHRRAVIVLGALCAVVAGVLLRDQISVERVIAHHGTLQAWRDTHFLLLAAMFAGGFALHGWFGLPGSHVLTFTGGFVFGFSVGCLLNMIGATLGALMLFATVRWGVGARHPGRLDEGDGRIRRIRTRFDENRWTALVMMRFVPFLPFAVANLLPALWGVSARRFVLATLAGILPGTALMTAVGAGSAAALIAAIGAS